MALQGLNQFVLFSTPDFLMGKRLVFLKALPLKDGDIEVGSKVVIQIVEDKTKYSKANVSNFGEQLTVKVRGVSPAAYAQFKPLVTEVIILDVERAVVYGEYRNQLSIVGKVAVKDAPTNK